MRIASEVLTELRSYKVHPKQPDSDILKAILITYKEYIEDHKGMQFDGK